MPKITDFPFTRAVMQQIDFAQLLTDDDCKLAEQLAVQISQTCMLHGKGNYEVMLGLMLYLEQVSMDYSSVAGIKPKSRVA
jgi:hypothetical protein